MQNFQYIENTGIHSGAIGMSKKLSAMIIGLNPSTADENKNDLKLLAVLTLQNHGAMVLFV